MHPIKKTQGSALLTALFIMTIVAIVATAMSIRIQLDIYRTRLIITHDKLYLASQAITFWALTELNNKKPKLTLPDKQGMIATYAKNVESIDKQIKITGGLYDLQARFNLNNIGNRKSIPLFINLMSQTVPQLNPTEKNNIALALENWLTPYDLSHGNDNYLTYYLAQKPPYYPSHQLMTSSSEFRLIKGVSATMYSTMEPFITALPEPTPVNINTASKEILLSLSHEITNAQADELIAARKESEKGIKDLKKISELLQKMNVANEQITIQSNYFLSVAQASSDDFNLVVYTVLKREQDKNGNVLVSTVRQSINSF